MDEQSDGAKNENNQETKNLSKDNPEKMLEESQSNNEQSKGAVRSRERQQRQKKQREGQSLGAKKLGATKIEKLPDTKAFKPDEIRKAIVSEEKLTRSPPLKQECWEEGDEQNFYEELKKISEKESSNTDPSVEPEELMSNLKFKDIFKPDGWEALGEDVELPNDLSDDKYHPVLDKLASQDDSPIESWGGWGSWGVSSLINTATASVSTLTSHVSQGLIMLEESMGIPDPEDMIESKTPTEEETKTVGMYKQDYLLKIF